jgi:putative flippase GtrA
MPFVIKNFISGRYWQFFIYIAVGVFTAILDVATMQILLLFTENLLFSLTVSYVLAVIFNFTCHLKFTFSFVMTLKVICKYVSIVFLNYFLTVFFMYFFVFMSMGALMGKIFSLPVAAMFGFVLSKKWVFK